MAHMNDNDRKRIEFLASSGFTVQEIADDLGRKKSTILRELINRSVESNRNYKCSNRICVLFDRCPRVKGYGRDAKRPFNCTPRCFEVCPDFIERFGKEGKAFLDKLGIVNIPANEVTLDPILLGVRFKRHADRVVLRKAGVIPAKKTEEQQ